MLQLLLMILKILGILLLVILGIILVLLLVVLFVPVRYRADVSFDGKPKGSVLVSWLLHLVTVRVNYDSSVTALVKVLWFRLFDKTVWPSEEPQEEVESLESLEDIPVVTDVPAAPVSAETVKGSDSVQKAAVNAAKDADRPVKSTGPMKPAESAKHTEPAKPTETSAADATPKSVASGSEETKEAEKNAWLETTIEKIVNLVQKTIQKISCMYQQICGKVDAGHEKLDMVRTFLSDEENQNTLRLLWRQLKKLFRHILPRKISGRVRFGFDDPATTGQILTYISPFYGLYAKTLEIEPVFDEKVMEGELHIKGHIRVASLLWIVVRVFLNKNFRTLLKKMMALGKK